MREFVYKILLEHAELTGKNVMLNWQMEQYESFIRNEKAGSSTNAFSSVVENEVLDRDKNLDKR